MCLDLECQTLGLQKNNVNVGFLKQNVYDNSGISDVKCDEKLLFSLMGGWKINFFSWEAK